MESFDPPHASSSRYLAGGLRRQVRAGTRLITVRGREARFDEKNVGGRGELGDGGAVCGRVSDIGDIGDLLPALDADQIAQFAERA